MEKELGKTKPKSKERPPKGQIDKEKEMESEEPQDKDKEASKLTDDDDTRLSAANLSPVVVIAVLFVISIGFALLLVPIYVDMGFQADFEELGGQESLLIPVFYIVIIVVFTAVILFITRKRKGRFIKYAFLGIICLSMIYVFTAISNAILYPTPPQEWSTEVDIDGGVSTILIADLIGDNDEELIVGTNDGNVIVYEKDLKMYWSTDDPLGVTITDLEVVNLDPVSTNELIVVSNKVTLFRANEAAPKIDFINTWQTSENNYKSSTVIQDYPLKGNVSLGMGPAVIVGTTTGSLEVISYYDNDFHVDPINFTNNLEVPINTLIYSNFNKSTQMVYIGTQAGIYSFYPIQTTPPKPIIRNLGNIIGLQVLNIDSESAFELVAWNDKGTIFIYEANSASPRWKKDMGDHIGGVAFDEIFEDPDGYEMVVSVDGRVYIYYSYDKFLDERFEFTEETGRLDKLATGVATADLDDNDEQDIIVGDRSSLKHYQYIYPVYSDIPCFIGLFLSVLLTILLYYYPEWYIVDITGIIVAAGVTALLGISIGLLPIIILLIVLAVYDAISVYKTKHMVSLADKVMEFRLPILLVVPKKRGYSFRRQKGLRKQLEEGEEREAMFIGLGDIIIPGALVISAFHFLPVSAGWFGLSANLLVALFTLVGTLIGFTALMHFVLKGNPQAGLPLLNTGAILGFFISNFAIYQNLTFGMVLPF